MFLMLFLMLAIASVLLVNVTERITRSVQLGTVDFAGRTQMEDMEGNATQSITVTQGMNYIRDMLVCYTTDGGALGSSVGFVIIEDTANGNHEIPCGGGGAELINGKTDSVPATLITNVNIPVKGGSDIGFWGQMSGEDSGDIVVTVTPIFSSKLRSQQYALKWIGREIQLTAIDTDVLMADLRSASTDPLRVPGSVKETTIDSWVGALGSDFGALGAGAHVVIKTRGAGTNNQPQECVIGGSGGELITGAGDTSPPVQEHDCDMPIAPNNNMVIESRMCGEDGGTLSVGIGFGIRDS